MTERLPLFSPAQYRLLPLGASGQRVVVRRAAERVDPDDLRAELREGHPAERRGDERRDLDDPQAGERRVILIVR